jgi:hypothetical protein
MKTDTKILLGIVAWFVMIVFTFGHAYNQYPSIEEGHFGGTTYQIHNGPGTKMGASLFMSIFWPLYWSVKVQEK